MSSSHEDLFKSLPADPTRAWLKLSEHELFGKWEDVPNIYPAKKPDGVIRIVCISDTHGKELKMSHPVPNGDILVHGGDITNTGELCQLQAFNQWLGTLPHKHKIVIAGNHDLTLDKESYTKGMAFRFAHRTPYDVEECRKTITNATVLENESCVVEGLNFYGSPYSARFHDWGFNVDRGEKSKKLWTQIPTETDILLTHGPPLGHGDMNSNGGSCGCTDLLYEVTTRIKPKLHVFGHIHEAYGVTTNGVTQFVNACTCDLRYKAVHKPLVFDIPITTRDK
eukprot:TRINITY_DN1888_c0_g1_i1.p1 TRINITY_DN1888_c0_g1~~TRINITY_DN1888_c0_g1_i1.p1  ORF type:complete len:294 (+),score=46.03 TRINITY_DN1888_c0_g1_i1:42-884(+)